MQPYHLCDSDLNFQIDAAYHDHKYDFGYDDRFHAGGIAFWRDQNVGVLGVDASFIGLRSQVDGYPIGASDLGSFFRAGVRGEYFVGDDFTLGAGIGHIGGDLFGQNMAGFDGNLWARAYATNNLAIIARLDVGRYMWSTETFNKWAVSGDAEYLLPGHPISIFAGAKYANIIDDFGGGAVSDDFIEEFAGLKVYFGSSGHGETLASHQRNNTLDNTSVLFEKTPEILDAALGSLFIP